MEKASLSEPLSEHIKTAQTQLNKAEIDESGREVYSILAHILDCDPTWVIAHSHEPFDSIDPYETFWQLIERRSKREPMAYLFGYRDFYKMQFKVGPGVLIPRPESEVMVEWVLEDHLKTPFKCGIDLCTGSGNIGLSLAKELDIPFQLLDTSEEALKFAKQNKDNLLEGIEVPIHKKDLLKDELSDLGQHDLITMNPPYVSLEDKASLQEDVRNFEPELALYGGRGNGLEFFMFCLTKLGQIANEGCLLYVELGFEQHKLLKQDVPYHGWLLNSWKKDLNEIPRISKWTYKSFNG